MILYTTKLSDTSYDCRLKSYSCVLIPEKKIATANLNFFGTIAKVYLLQSYTTLIKVPSIDYKF